MNSVPQHLLSEDRQEYERILDEALRSAPHHPELAAVGQRLNSEQLRTMALNASALITAAAAAEYQHYVKVREELRHPAPSTPSSARATGLSEPGGGTMGLATTVGEAAQVAEAAGAGAIAIAAVLTPVLAGTAAVIFLLVGYLLRAVEPDQAVAQAMLNVGWAFGAIAAAAILVATVGLLLTALRNRPSLEGGPYGELSEEVVRARDTWREALLERGILPFLREALADHGAAATLRPESVPPASPAPTGRLPKIGYDRPGFTSPDGGPPAGPRPSYSSPDYSSPDFGGPDHQPE